MIEITKIEELQYIVNKDPRVILVSFTSAWCTPCNLLIPQLQELEKNFANKCLVINIDIYKYKAFMNYFALQSIPTMVYYYNKKIWDTLTITGADIGTAYENVSILLTEHNDGVQPMIRALKTNPVNDLDSTNLY
jgi:thioredoxin 1